MIIDVHVHICPPEVRDERERFLKGEPEFAAIYKNPRAKLVGASELVAMMDEEGVDKALVFGFPWNHEAYYRLNNDYVIDASKRYPGRLIPFSCVKADHPKAPLEVERCLEAGAMGVGELAFYTTGLDESAVKALKPITDLCVEAKCPILLHTNEPVGHYYQGKSPMTLAQLYGLLKTYHETVWILAHLGGGLPFYAYMKKEVQDVLSKCWFDIAALPYLYRPQVLRALIEAVGVNKLLFGSDYPLLPPSRYQNECLKAGLNQKEIDAIFGDNAQTLLFGE